jgi:hypothetical protein
MIFRTEKSPLVANFPYSQGDPNPAKPYVEFLGLSTVAAE